MAARNDRPIIMICCGGKRSTDAGFELEEQGITIVPNLLEGFGRGLDAGHHRGNLSGCRKQGLVWRQV